MREGGRKRQRKKKGTKKWIGGKKVIPRGFDDWETAWRAYVECQLSENGKCVSEISLPWQICKRHFKDGNRVCGNHKNGKYVKPRGVARRGASTTSILSSACDTPGV